MILLLNTSCYNALILLITSHELDGEILEVKGRILLL